MSCCCEKEPAPAPVEEGGGCCGGGEAKGRDWLLLVSGAIIAVAYVLHLSGLEARFGLAVLSAFSHAVAELVHLMWWGTLVGIVAIALLQFVPRRRIEQWLGSRGNFGGLLRAVAAGIFFDLCSHGILLVSMQLYRKGLGLGQTMAFLIASPWNSFSTTFVLFALVGVKWTLLFMGGSILVALVAGTIFHALEQRGLVPRNPYRARFEAEDAANPEHREPGFVEQIAPLLRRPAGWLAIAKGGLLESRMVVRWMLFGVLLAAILRVAVDPGVFSDWFGPTLAGLGLTLLAATVIEVCSEGSSPIAADLLNRASAPGNGFAFLMAGAATDYTEILALRETAKSWKIALLLPAFTVPQVVLLGWLMNRFG